jgi:GDPmannose 4,6-dehydratase
MKKRALITGISGQDGSYLSEYLLSLGYEVFGIIRRHSTSENQENRIAHLEDKVHTFYGDVLDAGSIEKVMKEVMPDEIYNLAAQSHVRISSDIPQFTCMVNSIGALNVLEAYRKICPAAKFYQASSSEMFGTSVNDDGFQSESTQMNPQSPYGVSKVFAYNMVRHYRRAYKLHATNGILFNHESPRRGSNFVTSKVIKAAVRIKLGMQGALVLGNIKSQRDWGHSSDYVKAMHLIVNHKHPEDFVVSTGVTHSVEDMVNYVFAKLKIKTKDHISTDSIYMRPDELKYLKGDCNKIKGILKWEPTYTFETLMDEMIKYWLDVYATNKKNN